MTKMLWKIHFQSRKYAGDHDDITVIASNVKIAINRACKRRDIDIPDKNKLPAIVVVELLGEC